MIFNKCYFFYEMNQNKFDDVDGHYHEFTFSELVESDFKKNNIFKKNDRMRRYSDFIKSGHQCFGFFDQSQQVVSYLWLSKEGSIVPLTSSVRLKIGNGLAYIWDCRTSDDYQGRGLYKEGLKRLVKYSVSLGVNRVMICNLVSNKIANKTMSTLGSQYIDTISVFRFLSVSLVIGFSFFPKIVFKKTAPINFF